MKMLSATDNEKDVPMPEFLDRALRFTDLIQEAYNLKYLEALVISALFVRGGYVTMRFLEENLGVTGVSLSAVISNLLKKKPPLIRKNEERSPVPLVLLVSVKELQERILKQQEERKQLQKEYLSFLSHIASAYNRTKVKSTIYEAFMELFHEDRELGAILAGLNIQDRRLIEKKSLYMEVTEYIKMSLTRFNTIISVRSDLIQTHSLYRRSFLQSKYTLQELVAIIKQQLAIYDRRKKRLLEELNTYSTITYEDIIPYFYISPSKGKYSSSLSVAQELNRRLKLHLTHYTDIKVIWNNVYKGETKVLRVLAKHMKTSHTMTIVTPIPEALPPFIFDKNNIHVYRLNKEKVPPDYLSYDIILFGKEGQYYSCFFLDTKEVFNDITPSTIAEVLSVFK